MCRSVSFKLIIVMKDWVRLWMFEPNCAKNLNTLRFPSRSLNFESLFTREMAREWSLNSPGRLCDIAGLTSFPEFMMKLFDEMIDWKASKQKTIIISSIEVKLLTILMTANTKMWWDRFFEVIAFQIPLTHIECDNRQIIRAFIVLGASFSIKLRHVNIHRHWLRQEVQNERIIIQWTPSNTILSRWID